MPGTDGVDALRGLRDAGNPARVLVITSFTEPAAVLPGGPRRRRRLRLQGHRPARAGRRDPVRARRARAAATRRGPAAGRRDEPGRRGRR